MAAANALVRSGRCVGITHCWDLVIVVLNGSKLRTAANAKHKGNKEEKTAAAYYSPMTGRQPGSQA